MSVGKSGIRILGYISSIHPEIAEWVRTNMNGSYGGADATGKYLRFTCEPGRRLKSDDLRRLADFMDELDSKRVNEGAGNND